MSYIWGCDKSKIDPELADDLDKLLGPSEFDWEAYRGWASPKVQLELYNKFLAGGPLTAKPGHSAHECIDVNGFPASLAVDVARVDTKGHLLWDYAEHSAWPWLWQACRDHPRLHSGHRFPEDTKGRVPADNDHIQAVKWLQFKNKLIVAGKW